MGTRYLEISVSVPFSVVGYSFHKLFDVAPAFANLQFLRYLEGCISVDVIDLIASECIAAFAVATMSSRLVNSRVI